MSSSPNAGGWIRKGSTKSEREIVSQMQDLQKKLSAQDKELKEQTEQAQVIEHRLSALAESAQLLRTEATAKDVKLKAMQGKCFNQPTKCDFSLSFAKTVCKHCT